MLITTNFHIFRANSTLLRKVRQNSQSKSEVKCRSINVWRYA